MARLVRTQLRHVNSAGRAAGQLGGGLSLAMVWFVGATALAGDPIVLVGGPPVVADGQNTATVQIWSPAIGDETRISVKGAPLVGEPEVDGGDFASFVVTPPAATSAGELLLKVKVSSGDGKGAATLRVPVVPPDRGDVGIVFDPPLFRHGVDNAVSIRITPPTGPRDLDAKAFEVHSNVGVIDTVTAEDGGRTLVARWRPPKELPGSQMALFAVVDTAAPDRVLGTAAYPVVVKKTLELPAPAGTTAVLTVGERQFGPLPAGPDGRVRFEVERDPRVTVGRLRIVTADGSVTESDVELAFGEGPRFTFVPPPPGAMADPDKKVQVTVVAVNPDGSPWTGQAPAVKVDRGTVSGVVAASVAGRFVVSYTPDAKAGTVTFTATLDGQSASRSMQLVAPADQNARSGAFDPVTLEGSARDATFTIEGAAPGGIYVEGGALRGRMSGSGPFTQAVRLNGSSAQMVVRGGPPVQASGRPVTRLFMWTAESTVQADAARQVPVVVVAVDDQGQPVPKVPLALSVAVGTGSIPDELTTGADGVAAGLYTVGNQVGPVTLVAEGAGVRTAAPLFLEGAGYTGGELSVSGDARTIADRQAWMDAVAVARAGRPFPAAQPAVAPMTGADMARLEAEKKAQERAAKKAARTPAATTADSGGGSEKPAAASGGADPLTGFGPPPADGLGRSDLRVGLHFGAMPRNYSATSEGDGSVPGGEAEFTTPSLNAPSFDARAVKWFGTVGAEGRLRYVSQPLAVPLSDTPLQVGGTELLLGARLRGPIFPGLTWQLGGGFHAQALSAFTLTDAEIQEARETLNGVRIAGGSTLDRGAFYLSTELAGSFTLSPSSFQFDTVLGYEVVPNLAVQAVYSFTKRGATVADGDAEIDVSESLNGIFIGAAYTLP